MNQASMKEKEFAMIVGVSNLKNEYRQQIII